MAFAISCGVNISTKSDFKLPVLSTECRVGKRVTPLTLWANSNMLLLKIHPLTGKGYTGSHRDLDIETLKMPDLCHVWGLVYNICCNLRYPVTKVKAQICHFPSHLWFAFQDIDTTSVSLDKDLKIKSNFPLYHQSCHILTLPWRDSMTCKLWFSIFNALIEIRRRWRRVTISLSSHSNVMSSRNGLQARMVTGPLECASSGEGWQVSQFIF